MGRYGVDDPGQNDREDLWNKDLFHNLKITLLDLKNYGLFTIQL